MSAIVVTSAWVPARREPAHGSEMVTQWLCGETLDILECRESWVHCRGEDGYTAWAVGGGLLRVSRDGARVWRERARARSLGTRLERPSGRPACSDEIPNHLPWGARVELRPDGAVGLPGGHLAAPLREDALCSEDDRARCFTPDGAALTATARLWLGAPYLWGGRTRQGADCSGFVQAVFALHGVSLPRDSAEQRTYGRDLSVRPGAPPDLEPGDLLFFAEIPSGATSGEPGVSGTPPQGPSGNPISHVAISCGGAAVVHASESRGCVAVDDLASHDGFGRRLREMWVAATRPLSRAPA